MTPLPTEKEWLLDIYRQLMEETTPDGVRDFVVRHPVLLSVQALQLMNAWGCQRKVLAGLDRMRLELWDKPELFPRDRGPLNGVIEGLRKRELLYAEARARAIRLDCAGLLSNTYIKVVFEFLMPEVSRGGAFPTQAAQVVLDSAWSMPFENLATDIRAGAARGFILVVHAALTQNPDGGLLERAHEAGDWALEHVDWSGKPAARGELLHELGVMDLDAYTSRWPAGLSYMDRISEWLARATKPMPEPAVALARASRLLTEAEELRPPGSDRGATLKALLQSRMFEASATQSQPDREELRDLGTRALQHLDAQSDADAVEWTRRAMEFYEL